MSIYKKLHKIQSQVIGLKKDAKGNNYQYVSGEKVLDHIKPLMNELGLLLKTEILSIENERMDYRTGIGTNYEKAKSEILSKVMLRFTWIDTETGEKDENIFGANGQNDWDKGVGSALTYGERYFLLKYFHIATDEDDIDNPERKPEPKQKETKAAPAPSAELIELVKDTPNWDAVVKYVKANKTMDIEKIGAQLTRKYKISPALRKEIANLINA
jgi:hypothetical protein